MLTPGLFNTCYILGIVGEPHFNSSRDIRANLYHGNDFVRKSKYPLKRLGGYYRLCYIIWLDILESGFEFSELVALVSVYIV